MIYSYSSGIGMMELGSTVSTFELPMGLPDIVPFVGISRKQRMLSKPPPLVNATLVS